MWPTCIGLATLGELKSMTTVRGLVVFWKKRCSPRSGGNECLADGRWLEAEIEKAGAGDLDLFAPLGDVEFGDDVGGQLARVHLALLGQRHQRVGLVIAELGVVAGRTRTREMSASGKTARTAACNRCSIDLWGTQ